MAKIFNSKNGKKIVLRNPSEKGKRYARQLKNNKVEETGKPLSKTDRAFRIGYLTSRSDNAKAYKSKQRKKRGRGRPKGSKTKKKQ